MAIVTHTITSNGTAIDSTHELLNIEIHHTVNRIPVAEIAILDGDPGASLFTLSDSVDFAPGRIIEIKLRDESDVDVSVFKGVVVSTRLESSVDLLPKLFVQVKSSVIKLTQKRNNNLFVDKSDDQIIDEILKNAKIDVGTIVATKPVHKEMVQYYCTDWDFILSRIEAQGLLIHFVDDIANVSKIDLSGEVQNKYVFGIDNIYYFEMKLDASGQYQSVQSASWDIKEGKLTQVIDAKELPLAQGDLKAADSAAEIGFEMFDLIHPTTMDSTELQAWADGRLARNRLSMMRGFISVDGRSDIQLLDLLELEGFGERFNGTVMVSGISHRVSVEGWQTDIQFGVSPEIITSEPDIQDLPSAGLLPAVNGLQVGVVDQFDTDPEGELRVKVKLPMMDQAQGALWARLMTPDAGIGRGFFFRPEVGDEVIVGFFNNDPRQAVILGSMFSSKNTAPEDLAELSEDNIYKGITSRLGTTLTFIDDEKATVYIETPQKNTIVLSDDDQSILVSDEHGNQLMLNSDGITIDSIKDVVINASGDIKMGGTNITIEGSKVDIK